jgi:glycosyltransferase involved in cell wall biosynthesis
MPQDNQVGFMDFKKDIPIFIISYNRLTYLKKLIDFLDARGYQNIIVVDNNSTYPPLLEYLRSLTHSVHFLGENLKHHAVWDCGRFTRVLKRQYYVVTDCDVVPIEETPDDFLEVFYNALQRYRRITKVGFSLKIDDIPDHFADKAKVLKWEGQFWNKRIEPELYEATIDTTFALYKPGIYPKNPRWWKSIRVAYPYSARHLPWYCDSASVSDEDVFYQKTLPFDVSDWGHSACPDIAERFDSLLKEYRAEKIKYQRFHDSYIHIPKFWRKIRVFRAGKKAAAFLIKKLLNLFRVSRGM